MFANLLSRIRLAAVPGIVIFFLLLHSTGRATETSPAPRSASAVSFLNTVEPILTRAGCNQGACHGSQFGKGGFKLSLAGYDPDFDYDSMVRQARGRRIVRIAPAASLLLQKPALEVPHQGGLKLARGSADYRTLAEWLRQGAPGPNPNDPVVTGLRVIPAQRILSPGQKQAITVFAIYSDHSVRDVTAHTRISSLNDAVASVTPEGMATATGYGATAVMLRYDGRVAVSHLLVPYPHAAAKSRVKNSSSASTALSSSKTGRPNSYIDRLAAKQWQAMGLEPSELCTDSEFLRRVSLDVIGTLPSPEEVRTFLADTTPDKRERLVIRLLNRPEYADYWTVKWSDLLRCNRAALGEKGMWSFRNWIHARLSENTPYDRFVRDLITAQGDANSTGQVNYYRVASTPQDLTETTAQVFLGIRMQCAKCHHHPFEKWSQQDYYQFAAFFARVGSKNAKESGGTGMEPILFAQSAGEVQHPKTGEKMVPTPLALDNGPRLASGTLNADTGGDRRRMLAEWMTGQDNLQFAECVVNRYWGALMGRGIIHPVDDLRVTNPPSNPELLEALARDFVAHGYDLKYLIHAICASRVYQLSSQATPQNRADTVFYSHYLSKRQPAEVLLDSLCLAAGAPEKFAALPLGFRAIQLPDASVSSTFLDAFGRPPRATACECERSAEPDLVQALQLLNGELINRKVTQKESRITRLLASNLSDREIITELYYAALSRPPQSGEMQTALTAFTAASGRRQAAEDLLWALLNTREFSYIR